MKKSHRWFGSRKKLIIEITLVCMALFALAMGALFIWMSSLKLPDLNAFEQRRVTQSTKIYDRTGKIVLYDIHENIKRTLIPYDEVSPFIKNATVAIEDDEFYQHHGIRPLAMLRAIFSNLGTLSYGQGGSTITQQVIKNSLLTTDKTITRKLKEWVLAPKLEQVLDKDTILGIYLNENPYGGSIYGVEEASQAYYGKHASDVTLAEAAYLASLPQRPSYFSPFGSHTKELDERKNLVLKRMLEKSFITEKQYNDARTEKVVFSKPDDKGLKAPHFVFYIKDYLVKKYGEDFIEQNGLKVITTLDYELQQKAEDLVKIYALKNKQDMDAENASLVAIDPKTGQILVMVGSRDYFDKEINGNFNVALARRQPGSSFKPFVYAAGFIKGYLPDTVLFDVKTEFSTQCTPDSKLRSQNPNTTTKCYSPQNYDEIYVGPISLRYALAESRNVPAVKMLYLVGIKDSIQLAKRMGVTGLNDPDQYGLTLVLGGGEVSLLDMTSAYSTFANNGVRNPYQGILRIEDRKGNVLEEFTAHPDQVIDPEISLMMTDVLSDNKARERTFGLDSPLRIPGYDVAAKTGTTNDYRDAWILGYSPTIVAGAWAGNNDNRPIKKGGAARYIIAPLWNAFMKEALKKFPNETFQEPTRKDVSTLKPVIRGIWEGNTTYKVNKLSGELANEFTPPQLVEERVVRDVHDILYWVNKDDPLGPIPKDPKQDSQFESWEYGVQQWLKKNNMQSQSNNPIPTLIDTTHTQNSAPIVKIINPEKNATYLSNNPLIINQSITSPKNYAVKKVDYYLNNQYIGSSERAPFNLSIIPKEVDGIKATGNELKVIVTDEFGSKGEDITTFSVSE